MKIRFCALKKLCAVLCVVLIVAYASVVFLPHSHDSVDTDCAACLIIESTLELLYLAVLILAVGWLPQSFIYNPKPYIHILSGRESTPVGRKVKLSD